MMMRQHLIVVLTSTSSFTSWLPVTCLQTSYWGQLPPP